MSSLGWPRRRYQACGGSFSPLYDLKSLADECGDLQRLEQIGTAQGHLEAIRGLLRWLDPGMVAEGSLAPWPSDSHLGHPSTEEPGSGIAGCHEEYRGGAHMNRFSMKKARNG